MRRTIIPAQRAAIATSGATRNSTNATSDSLPLGAGRRGLASSRRNDSPPLRGQRSGVEYATKPQVSQRTAIRRRLYTPGNAEGRAPEGSPAPVCLWARASRAAA